MRIYPNKLLRLLRHIWVSIHFKNMANMVIGLVIRKYMLSKNQNIEKIFNPTSK